MFFITSEVRRLLRRRERRLHTDPPAVTVCIAESDIEGWYLRGIAICSAKDTPEKHIVPFDAARGEFFKYLEEDHPTAIDYTNWHGGRDWAMRRVKRAERMLKNKLKKEPLHYSTLNADYINQDSKTIQNAFATHGIVSTMFPTLYKTTVIKEHNLTDQERDLLK